MVSNKQKSDRLFGVIKAFVPFRVYDALAKGKRSGFYKNEVMTAVYMDVSGFTAMSEQLSQMGKEGAEEITSVINSFFSPLVDIITEEGGDIYRFGGDAIIAFFYGNSEKENALLALKTARKAVDFVHKNSTVKTSAGNFYISIHIGITTGPVFFKDLNVDFLFSGKSAHNVLVAVEKAEKGEIVVDTRTKKHFKEGNFERRGKSFFKVLNPDSIVVPDTIKPLKHTLRIKEEKKEKMLGRLKNYISKWLLEKIKIKAAFDASDGEHRKITVLFVHFSSFDFEKNPGKASSVLDEFYNTVYRLLEKYKGYMNKIDLYENSDRLLLLFGFPEAHEHDEERACIFAHELFSVFKNSEVNLQIGINTGYAFAAPVGSDVRREYTVMGDTVNYAARLASAAKPGIALVSDDIYKKNSNIFDFEFFGYKRFKGKSGIKPVYRLKGKKAKKAKKDTRDLVSTWVSESKKMVGRDKELSLIRDAIESTASKKGKIIGIIGEAGLGKSRLAREASSILKGKNFESYVGSCFSYGVSISYQPWISILNDIFGILPEDNQETEHKKIIEKTREVSRKLIDWLPIIGEVMGIPFEETSLTKFADPKLRKQRFFDIVFDFLKHEAKSHPIAIIIEDLHWADSASLELINYIARNIYNKNIMMIMVTRPINRILEFMEKDYYIEIRLHELKKEDTAKLVKSLLSIRSIPKDFKDAIVDKSQGNPFYTEEIIKSLIEQGYVWLNKNKKWKFTGDVKEIVLPDRVEEIILSRIDRLNLKERMVLQTTSVLGREFPAFLLQSLFADIETIKEDLSNLRRLDLIQINTRRGETRYMFKHVLTQEVAYGTLSFAKKRKLHKEVGTFIENKYAERKEEFLGLLSYHFYQGKDYDKALLYSVEAGEKAKNVYANNEAVEFFTRAINAYEKMEGKK